MLRDSVPFPTPPPAVRSDDERLHAHWVFARDQRRCAGARRATRTYDPVEVALPKLLRSGRRDEALKRVAMTRGAGLPADAVFTLLAADWLKAAIHEPWATVRMAQLLAERGDDAGSKWLKNAVRRPELAADAGPALVAVKAPLCPLLKAWFESDNWTDHQMAAVALATSGDPACAPGLVKLLQNAKARPEARAAAATALGSDRRPTRRARRSRRPPRRTARSSRCARRRCSRQIKPNAGRPKVIAMEKYLRDPSPEMRAAAAAGVVRAGGTANLDDLYVLFKDNDARPSLAALRELERVPSEKATKLIARLARRPQLEVQKAAAEMLIRRNARDYYVGAETVPRAESRSGASRAGARRPRRAAAAERRRRPSLGLGVYRARLARGEREQAIDWFLARGATLPPPQQAEAMADWVSPRAPPPPESKPTAAKTVR